MVLSLEHSSPLAQQRQRGRSGRASSSSHRVMQSSILTLRATSRTCFLWVIETPSPSKPLSSLPLSQNNFILLIPKQDVLSMLDQPGTFNDDDFEMPMYSQFNEWLLFLCCPLVCFAPRPFIPSAFLCWTDVLFPRFAWLQLHCLQVNPSLLYLFSSNWQQKVSQTQGVLFTP